MEIYRIAFFVFFLASSLFADFKNMVDSPAKLADLVEKIIQSKQDLENFKIELEKVPLFLKGCKMVKTTDPRYPQVRVVHKNLLLKDSAGRLVPVMNPETGRQAVNEQGAPKYKKVNIACDDLKDALSAISKFLEFIETKILGTASLIEEDEKNKAVFVELFELIGQSDKVSGLYDLSKTIEGLRFFIERVDKVMKIERKKEAQAKLSAGAQ